jgi:predicted thioesterase
MIELNKILKPGKNALVRSVVQKADTAAHYSVALANFMATPILVDMTIRGAIEVVDRNLPEEYITVGTAIELAHEVPTALGMTVHVKVTLKEIIGMKLIFDVLAWDDMGEIARGHHIRAVVRREQYLERTAERLAFMTERNV